MAQVTKILVPTDFSEGGERALALASGLAERNGAGLHVLHVLPMGMYGWVAMPNAEQTQKIIADHVRQNLGKLVAKLQPPAVWEVIPDVSEAAAIARYVEMHDIDLVVMGTHARKGIDRVLLGSVAAGVLRKSAVSVALVGPKYELREGGFHRVLAPVDFSERSIVALQQAAALASQHQSELVVLHVIEPPSPVPYVDLERSSQATHDRAAQALSELIDTAHLVQRPVQRLVVTGHPDEQIATHAGALGADIIVMGTLGVSGLERLLLGSTTARVIRHAPCAVLAHRGAVLDNL